MAKYSITKDPAADNIYSLAQKDLTATAIEVTKNPGNDTVTFQKNAATKARIVKAGGGVYSQPAAADLNGSTQYITWGLSTSPVSDGNTFSFAVRFKRTASGNDDIIFWNSASRIRFRIYTDNKIYFDVRNTSGTVIVSGLSTATYTDSGSFAVAFMSCNNTLGQEKFNLYIDDTDFNPSATPASNVAIDLQRTDCNFGTDGSVFHDGCYGPVWFSSQYIDWSTAANRERVISAPGVLNDPGADGSNWSPTSAQPEVYIADTASAPTTNDGSGINPAIVGGPFSSC